MKVSTRIITGYGVLILMTVAVLSYQVLLIQQLHAINHGLSEVNVGHALAGIDLKNDVALVKEWAQKYYVAGDRQYLAQFHDAGNDLESDLKKLRSPASSEPERQAIDRFAGSWQAVQATISREQVSSQTHELSPPLQGQFDAMRMDSERVLDATQAAIKESAKRSAETAARAVRVFWYAAAAALLLGILISALMVWSIAPRLRELAGATRVVAAGQFDHRLPATGTDEFADLARDFNSMAHRLGALDQMKKDFVSHVSHDLKGPLASTRETVNLLMEEIPGPLNEKQRRLLGLCLKSSARLSAMIGNLLDVSRMEAGMMDYKIESRDLALLARNAAAEFEGLAHEKNIHLVVESSVPELWVDCDHGRITQVICNLLENAIKFSPQSGDVGLRIESSGAHALLSVWDRGPGVPRASQARIFDRFHQVNPGKKIAGQGVGLGLAICWTIVKAHAGAIWVEDNPGGGSIFFVKLPSVRSES